MVTFVTKESDEAEEKKIKSLGKTSFLPVEKAADEDGGAGGLSEKSVGLSEKSVMPGKRSAPVSAYFVTVRTLQGKEVGPFTLGAVSTVAALKAKVAEAEGMQPEQRRLFFEIPKHTGKVMGGGAHKLE